MRKPWKMMITSMRIRTCQQSPKMKMVRIFTRTWSSKFALVSWCFRDYEKKDELDRYEQDGIDDEDQEELDFQARRNAERELDQDQKMRVRNKSRMPGAFFDEEIGGEYSEDELGRTLRLERMR